MDKSRARTISFVCGILAIILGFSAYSDITSGAMAHDTAAVIFGYVKIFIAIVLAVVFTIYNARVAK